MSRKRLLSTAFAALLPVVAGHAWAQVDTDNNPRFDGAFVVTALNGASCAAVAQVGDSYPVIYRVRSSGVGFQYNEAATIFLDKGIIFLRANGDGNFRGTNQSASGEITYDSFSTVFSGSVVNFTFTQVPAGTTVTPQTIQMDVSGTATNFAGVPGCTVTLRGAFTRRPGT
jgi:hypothetical protein